MFRIRRRARRQPLGEGVWRRVNDRFRRGVDRYHQVLESLPTGATPSDVSSPAGPPGGAEGFEQVGRRLAVLTEQVYELCVRAQALAPSASDDIVPPGPGGRLLDAHRALTRAAGLVAQAAESATFAAGRSTGAATGPGTGATAPTGAGTGATAATEAGAGAEAGPGRGSRQEDPAGGAERAAQQASAQVERAATLIAAAESEHAASVARNSPSPPTEATGRY